MAKEENRSPLNFYGISRQLHMAIILKYWHLIFNVGKISVNKYHYVCVYSLA
jgi:hypothetical protein